MAGDTDLFLISATSKDSIAHFATSNLRGEKLHPTSPRESRFSGADAAFFVVLSRRTLGRSLYRKSLAETLELSAGERAFIERRLDGAGPHAIAREADDALARGLYREAAKGYRQAAAIDRHESRLVWKARLMSALPWLTGPVLRSRRERIEDELGIDERHVR